MSGGTPEEAKNILKMDPSQTNESNEVLQADYTGSAENPNAIGSSGKNRQQ